MSDFQNAIQNYINNQSSRVQESLENRESGESSKASLLQAQTSLDENMAGTLFSDKLKEEGNKMQADMMTDLSAAGIVPTVLRKGANLALQRSQRLSSPAEWRKVNARRQAIKEGMDPDEAVPPENPIQDAIGNFKSGIEEGINTVSDKFDSLKQTFQAQRQPDTQNQILETDPEENITGGELKETETPNPTNLSETTTQNQIMESDPEGNVSGITSEVQQASKDVSDLAPEIGEAGDALGSFAGALSDAIPVVAFGIGAWALGEGIADEIKGAKDSLTDPFSSVRGEIAQAQGKINSLENNISADQFSEKIGAGTPSFGSLASRPNLDTSQMSGIALHV